MPASTRTIAITGASGFLGSAAIPLLLDRGYAVRAVSRRALAADPRVESVLLPEQPTAEAFERSFGGADAVIHLMGRAHVMREVAGDPLELYRAANVEVTRQALAGALRSACRLFVFASSVKAVGERTTTPWTEDTVPHPEDHYGRTKLEAEALVTAAGAAGSLRTRVLRLPLLYGPGMRGNMLRLFRAVDRGLPLPLGRIENRRSLAFTGNVVHALDLLVSREGGSATCYFVSDGQDYSSAELVQAIATALGRPARLFGIPPVVLRLVGRCGDVLARLGPWPVTSAATQRLSESLQVDIARIRRELGYVPPFSLAEGIAMTAGWFRSTQRTRVPGEGR